MTEYESRGIVDGNNIFILIDTLICGKDTMINNVSAWSNIRYVLNMEHRGSIEEPLKYVLSRSTISFQKRKTFKFLEKNSVSSNDLKSYYHSDDFSDLLSLHYYKIKRCQELCDDPDSIANYLVENKIDIGDLFIEFPEGIEKELIIASLYKFGILVERKKLYKYYVFNIEDFEHVYEEYSSAITPLSVD